MSLRLAVEKFLSEALAIDPAELSPLAAIRRAASDEHALSTLRAAVRGTPSVPTRAPQQGVAIIELTGLIVPTDSILTALGIASALSTYGSDLKAAAADPAVHTIALYINSVGGSVLRVPEAAHLTRAIRDTKRIVAMIEDACCSAAFWIGANASTITASPSSRIGSLGVVTERLSDAKQLEHDGVEIAVISSSPAKAWGHHAVAISADERQYIQQQVNDLNVQLHADVALGRRVGIDVVRRTYGQGRCVTAAQALAAGMIDAIATSDVSLQRIMQGSTARTTLASARTAIARAATAAQHSAMTRTLLAEPRAALAAARLAAHLRSE